MSRILSIDYGTKRTGIAATDPLKLSVNGLTTLPTEEVLEFLKEYLAKEEVEKIVVGEPLHATGQPGQIHHLVIGFVRKLQRVFPKIEIVLHDERFTSEDARSVILQSGARQKKRRDKSLVDKVSAVLILKDYLETSNSW